MVITLFFNVSRTCLSSSVICPKTNSSPLFDSSFNGAHVQEEFGTDLQKTKNNPKHDQSSDMFIGYFEPLTASHVTFATPNRPGCMTWSGLSILSVKRQTSSGLAQILLVSEVSKFITHVRCCLEVISRKLLCY